MLIYDVPIPTPPTRGLYSSSALRVEAKPPAPRKPVLCECGQRAGWFREAHYYCSHCQVVVSCFPQLGRVLYTEEPWYRKHPETIDTSICLTSQALDPEDPEIF